MRWKSTTKTVALRRNWGNIMPFKARPRRMKLGEIATDVSEAFDIVAYAPLNMKYCPHQIKLRRTDVRMQHFDGRPPLDNTDRATVIGLSKVFVFLSASEC
jgi:hypothetical protein